MKKIGLLGGSFDPIHFGHIHLGISLQEMHDLDEVIVSPAAQSPSKAPTFEDGIHRLEMARLAIEEIPSWRVLDWEVKRKDSSYTIDVVRHLLNETFTMHQVQLYLLLGEDLLDEIDQWKEAQTLFGLVQPLIGCRALSKSSLKSRVDPKVKAGLTETKVLEISATEVRERLKKGQYCGHLVPAKVLDYIALHQLY